MICYFSSVCKLCAIDSFRHDKAWRCGRIYPVTTTSSFSSMIVDFYHQQLNCRFHASMSDVRCTHCGIQGKEHADLREWLIILKPERNNQKTVLPFTHRKHRSNLLGCPKTITDSRAEQLSHPSPSDRRRDTTDSTRTCHESWWLSPPTPFCQCDQVEQPDSHILHDDNFKM